MKDALIILESNELMRHLILFKLYVEGNGESVQNIYVKKPIKELFGDEFDDKVYSTSLQYLLNKGYTNRHASYLTHEGLVYFEGWLNAFIDLTEEETKKLNDELPKPIFDFFKFSSESTKVLSFINQILKLAERF